jgi:HK97 family phage prohead protease
VLARAAVIRRAARQADHDESVPVLVAALDAVLDQASAALDGGDTASAGALITAAEALADDLMDLLGIPDPGDASQAAQAKPASPRRAAPRLASARQVAQMRADAMRGQRRGQFPSGAARMVPAKATLRHEQTTHNGKVVQALRGYATVYDLEYEMWDMFGPYGETVAAGAGAASLAANPDVAFLVNHRGMTMARTTNGTLTLAEDARGLNVDPALLNPERHDVHDLLVAIDDKNVTEMSFAFMITAGTWDEDFEHFTIEAYDIDRGDVSAVNYGANPYTSIGARSREIMGDLRHMPAGAQRAAYDVLAEILGPYRALPAPVPEPGLREVQSEPPADGWSVDYAAQLLALGVKLS